MAQSVKFLSGRFGRVAAFRNMTPFFGRQFVVPFVYISESLYKAFVKTLAGFGDIRIFRRAPVGRRLKVVAAVHLPAL